MESEFEGATWVSRLWARGFPLQHNLRVQWNPLLVGMLVGRPVSLAVHRLRVSQIGLDKLFLDLILANVALHHRMMEELVDRPRQCRSVVQIGPARFARD